MSRKDSDGVEEAAMAAVAKSEELPERWSARAKTETVLRLLKGEDIGTVSRETQVPVHELKRWRRLFLEGGTNGLKRQDTPGGRARAQARAGEGGRADDEARDRGVVPGKKRLRGGIEEVEALRGTLSPGTQRRYTVTLICAALRAQGAIPLPAPVP
jgi:transposase-like protein